VWITTARCARLVMTVEKIVVIANARLKEEMLTT